MVRRRLPLWVGAGQRLAGPPPRPQGAGHRSRRGRAARRSPVTSRGPDEGFCCPAAHALHEQSPRRANRRKERVCAGETEAQPRTLLTFSLGLAVISSVPRRPGSTPTHLQMRTFHYQDVLRMPFPGFLIPGLTSDLKCKCSQVQEATDLPSVAGNTRGGGGGGPPRGRRAGREQGTWDLQGGPGRAQACEPLRKTCAQSSCPGSRGRWEGARSNLPRPRCDGRP